MLNMGTEFTWWMAVVEDRGDPLQLGRCRVRSYGFHSQSKSDTRTDNLPWAQPIQSITSAAMGDVGYTALGLVEGTWVVGFFLDGKEAQRPVIMGSISAIPAWCRAKHSPFGVIMPSNSCIGVKLTELSVDAVSHSTFRRLTFDTNLDGRP